jgi:hypothetical protein
MGETRYFQIHTVVGTSQGHPRIVSRETAALPDHVG